MFRNCALRVVVLAALAATTLAGVSYTHGQWYGGGGTVASSNMNGMASMISSKGSYNLATSAAAINATQAQSQEIQNRQAATNTYFSMRATNRAATEQERGPHPSMEQLARMARSGAPKPFSANDMDPVTGRIAWPEMLLVEQYAPQRDVLDQLEIERSSTGRLSFPDQMKGRQEVEKMFGTMKAQIRDVPSKQYMESHNFLRSLIYSIAQSDLP